MKGAKPTLRGAKHVFLLIKTRAAEWVQEALCLPLLGSGKIPLQWACSKIRID